MKRHPWTAEQLDLLRARYADTPAATIALETGHTISSVYQRAAAFGLRKSAAYYASAAAGRLDGVRGGATRFRPGHATWNKGAHYNPGGRSVETRFKPGRKPEESRNYLPIGSLRINADGLLERKITDDQRLYPARRWAPVHRLVWESANGPVPPGHIVVFKGGRTTQINEITLDRVELITRAEHARRNHPRSRSPELARLVQLKGAITRQVNRIAKGSEK